jgi:sialate O-acetylesterase
MRPTLALVFALLVSAGGVAGPARRLPLKLHALFSDNAVFQSGMLVPVWGTAEPGEEVTVEFEGQKKRAAAGQDGKWRIRLDSLPPGGPYEMTVAGKAGSVAVKNILVGEVWLGSGQSNMEWSVKNSANPAEEIAAAAYPKIRLFTAPRRTADAPQADVEGSWKECSPETVSGFSAVAYYFGRELHRALRVPVGLIHSSWGGTPAEVWTRREVFDEVPELKECLDVYARRQADFEKAAAKAKEEGKPAPRAPWKPSCLYNGMIAPLVPYAIRGAIWYQGESNASAASLYRTLFPAMIRNWRRDWGQGDFPFLFVQLANFMARRPQPADSAWAELREAQLQTLSLNNTGMAVIIDIGDEKDIHPKNKQDVGKRLALAAQGIAYDRPVVFSGPTYESMKVEGGRVRLSFKHAGRGLVARGEKLLGFAVAGEDRKFVWADAKIEDKTVVVWSEAVPHPAAVRYGWADNPECTLYNEEGLPASPFRTDAWPRAPIPPPAAPASQPEKKDGWILLWDGKTSEGWSDGAGAPLKAECFQDGTLNPQGSAGHMAYTKARYGNFVFSCEVKVSKGCNSGVFFRVGNPKDPVQTGFEMQVFDSAGKEKPGKHDAGALYDAVAPAKNAMKPAGEWNQIEITADKARVKIVLNGETVVDADLDQWTEPGKNPDGSKNKYKAALKDFPREGHLGLQDHGHAVWYRNLKLKPLP